MERFTTDTPQGNTSSALNLFYIKDGETWVRGGGPEPDYADVRLYDYIREVVETLKADIDAGLSDDDLGECLYELLADGNSTMEGVVATLYMAAWVCSSLRAKLAAYEDTGLEPEDIETIKAVYVPDHQELKEYRAVGAVEEFRAALRRTAEDDKAREEGLLVVLPCAVGQTVWVISKCENVRMSRDDDYFMGTGAIECPFESSCDTEDCDDNHIRIFETVLSDFWYGDENEKRPEMFLEHMGTGYKRSDFGKTVFLTRQEAEAALEVQK